MDCKKISNTLPFKGFNIYKATAYVQDHTLINRGITTLGGSTVPQCIMSNNKYEAQERAIMGGVYFVASYLTPILLIPLYNKHFLKNKGITKSLEGLGKKIIQVPKKYLTPNGDLKKGLEETAKKFDSKSGNNECQKTFEEIYNRYNNEEKLKKDLLSVHEKVLTTDYITTAGMWSLIPWIATETTEHRTKRTDFSAGFKLKENKKKSQEEWQKSKNKKILWNVLFCVIPGILFAKAVTKGLSTNISKELKNSIHQNDLNNLTDQEHQQSASPKNLNNINEKGFHGILKKIGQNPSNFDYMSGTNMSKTIYAAIWVLSSFPAKIISSRDKNERKDRALRDIGLFTMFFGGDFLINNIAGRLADKVFGTKIMESDGKDLNFIQKFKLKLRNFRKLEQMSDMTPELLKKTKTIGAGIYWFALLTNTALIGFALPRFLNKFLRYNIKKEGQNPKINYYQTENISMEKFINK